jgi:hypothetical protein
MAGNGVSKVISRRMPRDAEPEDGTPESPGRRFARDTAEVEEAA